MQLLLLQLVANDWEYQSNIPSKVQMILNKLRCVVMPTKQAKLKRIAVMRKMGDHYFVTCKSKVFVSDKHKVQLQEAPISF